MMPSAWGTGRASAAPPVAGLTQRFQVDLRKTEIVVYSKLLAKSDAKEAGTGIRPASSSASKDPIFGDSFLANDPLPTVRNQYSAVIERIERLYANPGGCEDEDESLEHKVKDDSSDDDSDADDGGSGAEGEDDKMKKQPKKRKRAKDPKDDYYDTDDSWIDDTDLDKFFEARGVPQQASKSGFFINKGAMAENTMGVFLPAKAKAAPRKRVQATAGKGDASSNPPLKSHRKKAEEGSGANNAGPAADDKATAGAQQGKGKAPATGAAKKAAPGKLKPALGAAAVPASAATSGATETKPSLKVADASVADGAGQADASHTPSKAGGAAGTGVVTAAAASTEDTLSKSSKDIYVVAQDKLLTAIRALPPCTETNISKMSVPQHVRELMELCVGLLVKRNEKDAEGKKMKQLQKALHDAFGPLGFVDSKIQKLLDGHVEKAKKTMATLQADLDRAKESLRALVAAAQQDTGAADGAANLQTSPAVPKGKFVWTPPMEDALHMAVSKLYEMAAEKRGHPSKEQKDFFAQLCAAWPWGGMTPPALQSALEAAEKRLKSAKKLHDKVNRERQKLLGLPGVQGSTPRKPAAAPGGAKKAAAAMAEAALVAKAAAGVASSAPAVAATQAHGGQPTAPTMDDDLELLERPPPKKAKGAAGHASAKGSHAAVTTARSSVGAVVSGKDQALFGHPAGNVTSHPVATVLAAKPAPTSSPATAAAAAAAASVGPSPGKVGASSRRITPVSLAAPPPMPPAVMAAQAVPSPALLAASTNSNSASGTRRLTPTLVSQPPPS